MKKIISLLLAVCITVAVNAQNKKGNWLIGTGIGSSTITFGSSETTSTNGSLPSESEATGFNIGVFPLAGYYFTDKVVIGASASIGYSRGKSEGGTKNSPVVSISKYSSTYIGLGPFARVYFGNNSGKGTPFTEITTSINYYLPHTNENKSGTSSYNTSYDGYISWSAGAKLGYEHFITEVLGLQYYIGYSHSYSKYTVDFDFSAPATKDYSSTYKSNSGSVVFGTGIVIHFDRSKKKTGVKRK